MGVCISGGGGEGAGPTGAVAHSRAPHNFALLHSRQAVRRDTQSRHYYDSAGAVILTHQADLSSSTCVSSSL